MLIPGLRKHVTPPTKGETKIGKKMDCWTDIEKMSMWALTKAILELGHQVISSSVPKMYYDEMTKAYQKDFGVKIGQQSNTGVSHRISNFHPVLVTKCDKDGNPLEEGAGDLDQQVYFKPNPDIDPKDMYLKWIENELFLKRYWKPREGLTPKKLPWYLMPPEGLRMPE